MAQRASRADMPAPADPAVRACIAQELEAMRTALEDLGEALCADRALVRRHLTALQAIDELCQRHEHLARILRGADMMAEVRATSLDALRLRLCDRLAGRAA